MTREFPWYDQFCPENLTIWLNALFQYPDIQEELRIQLSSVIKDKNQITIEDLDRVPLLEHTIKESLRIYPIVASGGRMMQDDLKFGKYTVPKGNMFVVHYGVYHMDEQYFKQPQSFCPFRFSEEGKHWCNVFNMSFCNYQDRLDDWYKTAKPPQTPIKIVNRTLFLTKSAKRKAMSA